MRNDDARSLDHATLEVLRIRAVRSVQAGGKSRGYCACPGCYGTDDVWLVGTLPARRLGRIAGEAAVRPTAEAQRARDEIALRYGNSEEPATTEIRVCVMDTRHGCGADQEEIQRHAGGQFGWPVGITCQKPLHRAIEREPSRIQQWLEKDYPRIKALAKGSVRVWTVSLGNGSTSAVAIRLSFWNAMMALAVAAALGAFQCPAERSCATGLQALERPRSPRARRSGPVCSAA